MEKIYFKIDGLEVSIETLTPFKLNDIKTLISSFYSPSKIHPTSFATPIQTPVPQSPMPESEPFKKRLPNREQIRLDELKVKAEPNSIHSTFRCPNCHQSVIFSIGDDIACVRPLNEEGALYSTDVDDLTYFDYESALKHKHGLGDIKIVASETVQAHCPCCQQEHSTKEWIECYNITTDKRLKEEVCDICGSDKVLAFCGKEQNMICDNDACSTRHA